MKKIIIFLLTAVINLTAFAQVQRKVTAPANTNTAPANSETEDANKSGKHSKKEMMRALNLSKEQKAKLKEIHQANKSKKQAIEDNDKLTDDQKKIQLKQLHKEGANSTQAILNEEQKAKMKEMRKEISKNKKNDPNRPHRGVTGLPNERTTKPGAANQ